MKQNKPRRIYKLSKAGESVNFDYREEAADFLGVFPNAIFYANKRHGLCKGWKVEYLALPDLEDEFWCDHPILNVKVSSCGRVRRPSGSITAGSPCATQNGFYRYFHVEINRKWFQVHRLVAETFLENPENKPEIDHIDRNGFNNNLENLRWVTRVENQNNKSNNKK